MLAKFESFIRDNLLTDKNATSATLEKKQMVATTVLFLEMAFADFEISPEEEKQIESSLMKFFNLESWEVSELIELAKEKRSSRNDIWLFTNTIKSEFTRQQKLWIIEKLWQLIFADGKIDKYEETLIRKITTLLGLEHGDMIQAKLAVKNKSA
ncbi:MAG: TerB family tellurite resistance protein [Calditrichaceae bacterium]